MSSFSKGAGEILNGQIIKDCCYKTQGYSLVLAGIYYLFGFENLFAVRLFQIFLDLVNALLVFGIAKKMFGRKAALVSYILYILNPFTAAYTGLALSEIVTLFYIVSICFIVTRDKFSKSFLLWFIYGSTLGLLVFTRLQFYPLSLVLIFLPLIKMKGITTKTVCFAIIFSGYIFASLYSLKSNWLYYRKISVVPVTNQSMLALYAGFYNGARYPEIDQLETEYFSPDYVRTYQDFTNAPDTDKSAFNRKYSPLFFARLKKDWPVFIKNRVKYSLWLWDKSYLYSYHDPFYPADSKTLQIINIVSIIFFFAGIGNYIFSSDSRKKSLTNLFFIITVLFFVTVTFLFSLVSSESRHSLSFYVVMYVWSGYGLYSFISAVKNRFGIVMITRTLSFKKISARV